MNKKSSEIYWNEPFMFIYGDVVSNVNIKELVDFNKIIIKCER